MTTEKLSQITETFLKAAAGSGAAVFALSWLPGFELGIDAVIYVSAGVATGVAAGSSGGEDSQTE